MATRTMPALALGCWKAACIHNLDDELGDLAPSRGFVQVTPELLSGHTTVSKATAILNAKAKSIIMRSSS